MKVKVLTATNVLQTPSKGNWWPDQVLHMSCPSRASNEGTLPCSSICRKSTSNITTNVDFIAGDANAAAYNTTRGVPRFVQIFSCRHVERNATRDGTPTWKQTSSWFLLYITTFLSFVQQIILIVASNRTPRGLSYCWGRGLERAIQTHEILTILWLHLKTNEVRQSGRVLKRSLDTTNRFNLALS